MKPTNRKSNRLAVAATGHKARATRPTLAENIGGARGKGRTILVPVNLPDYASGALDYGWLMAQRMDASVLLVHVMERSYAGGLRDSWASRDSEATARRETLRKLSKFASLAKLKAKSNVRIKCLVREGIPQYEILRMAEEHKVSLIILGRQSRGPLSRMVFGSTTGPVVDHAPCPVVVVPEKAELPETW